MENSNLNSNNKDQVDNKLKEKLDKIIERSRNENEALKKMLEGLNKLIENSKK